MIESVVLHCPYCGESFESGADTSVGDQDYTEDCAVCCRPIVVSLRVDHDDGARVATRREQD